MREKPGGQVHSQDNVIQGNQTLKLNKADVSPMGKACSVNARRQSTTKNGPTRWKIASGGTKYGGKDSTVMATK